MRKSFAVLFAVICMLVFIGVCYGEDVILEKKIDRVNLRKDKNGAPYASIIVQDTKELQGVKYEAGTALMAFGDQYGQAKNFKKGDTIKCVASKREFNGRTSYTILKVVH